jgi:hypothetical protein
MNHSITADSTGGASESIEPLAESHETASSADLPLERSRFTRWLASFGLGEATEPW